MEPASPKYPFEVGFEEVQANLDTYVSRVFSTLKSEFLVLPKGEGFVEYPQFEQAYEALKKATGGFESLSPSIVLQAVIDTPLILVVLRTMLGFTPPELAYVASQVELPRFRGHLTAWACKAGGERSSRWQEGGDPRTHRSTEAGWWSWCEPGDRSRSWRGSSK
ncbi:MAG: hypothetical protein ABSA52_12480 [Candidatus Binatia bacterium]|jgi:hypothetical protein